MTYVMCSPNILSYIHSRFASLLTPLVTAQLALPLSCLPRTSSRLSLRSATLTHDLSRPRIDILTEPRMDWRNRRSS